jgi:cytochrome d ubiquinol oxidase subunit I
MNLALLLSRVQFAWVIGWHILLPAFTVGLASYIAVLETLYFVQRREVFFRLSSFWTKIFAVSFGMGVVSGVIMPFQFGSNWSRYADVTANVLSPLFTYEVLLAFFLESAFLGVLLFGRQFVPRWAHLVAGLMVALGTLLSSFWILAANSWMHTPAGYKLVDGRFFPVNWIDIIFNPSFPYRFAHTIVAFYITTALVVLGVGAYYLRTGRHRQEGGVMFYQALGLLTVFVPLQIFIGDAHGLNTLKYQPAKLAAIEARWDTQNHFPLTLFAIPDEQTASNRYALDIPDAGSLLLTHSRDGAIKGLKSFPRDEWPPVIFPFFAFRIMVGIGLIMLALVISAWILKASGRLLQARRFLRLCQFASPLGFAAVLAGWTTTEVGRQPWTVYGLLRTADSVSPSLTGANVAVSLIAYGVVYLVMYPVGVRYMLRIIQRGLSEPATQPEVIEGGRPEHPVEALPHEEEDTSEGLPS